MKMNKSRGHTLLNGNMCSFAKNSTKIPAELLKNLEIEQRIQISSTTSRNHSSFESTLSTVQMLTKERRWPELASEHLQENFRKVLEAWQLARAIRYRGNDTSIRVSGN